MKQTLLLTVLSVNLLLAACCGNANKKDTAGGHTFQIEKVTDYLYETTLDFDFDYKESLVFNQKYGPLKTACSAISIGKMRGRNLDWFYGDGAEFVVRTPKTENRHASIGVVPLTALPNEKIDDGQYHPEFEMLPYLTLDGINDAGICINLNVVNYQEMGPWQMKTETTDDDMLETTGPRMILDNCSYLTDVIPLYDKYDWIAMGTIDETHFMVSGPRSAEDSSFTTVVFEFIPFTEGGKTFRRLCCISPDARDIAVAGGDASRFYHSKADPFIMTNFNLWQFDASLDRKGRLRSATAHVPGFERYETVEAAAKTAIDLAGGKDKLTTCQMQDIMRTVYYSNMYNLYKDNFWYSEESVIARDDMLNFTDEQRNPRGDINKLFKGKDNGYFNLVKGALKLWANRDRTIRSDLWETLHTTIFNYENRSFQINVHEGTIFYEYKL